MQKAVTKGKRSPNEWAAEINGLWAKSAAAFVAAGQALYQARSDLGKGSKAWEQMMESLEIDDSKVSKLLKIGAHAELAKLQTIKKLPPSFSTIYALAQLEPTKFTKALKHGDIHPNMDREDALHLRGDAKAKPEKEDKPAKPKVSREADEAEVVEVEKTKSIKAADKKPSKGGIEAHIDNFDGAIESVNTWWEYLEVELEKAGNAPTLPKELLKKIDNLVELLQRVADDYTT